MAFWIHNEDNDSWKQWVKNALNKVFPDREISIYNPRGKWQSSRHIKVSRSISNKPFHYEYPN